MTGVLIQIFALIGLGLAWGLLRPGRIDIDVLRHALNSVVYYLFLPALVLQILWHAPLNLSSFKISLAAAISILASLALAVLVCRACRADRRISGAMILAAAFPNATYLGLPLLESTFGPWTRSLVIQFDMFACFPLVLTVGVLIASRYGEQQARPRILLSLLKVPPIWAVIIAVGLNLLQVPMHAQLTSLLESLSSVVIPLMLFSVGLALNRGLSEWRKLPVVIPVAVIQLFFMPLVIWGVAHAIDIRADIMPALVIEAALPSMALGIVLCDRFGLNSGVYAAAMTLTTIISFFTLPLWYAWVT